MEIVVYRHFCFFSNSQPPCLLHPSLPFPYRYNRPQGFKSSHGKVRAKPIHSSSTNDIVTTSSSRWADRLLGDFHFSSASPSSSNYSSDSDPPILNDLVTPARTVPLPLHFYQVLGAEPHFLGDGIRRAYEARASGPPLYGYSQESLLARRQILQAAFDTLLNPDSRRDYNRGLLENTDLTVVTDVPWDKVPGALCLLQESGETEVVLMVGSNLLKERLQKSFKRDVVLAMVLAFVEVSRDAMLLKSPDFCKSREMLEKALKLLQEEGASNLAPDLQAQIDETLEEIAPRSVLELLALPLNNEHKIRREEGLHGIRNILWTVGVGGAAVVSGGFTREDIMKKAFLRMTALEQVDLFASTPSNIPPESFEVYGVALALVSQAVVRKKPHLIKEADNLFQQLQNIEMSGAAIFSECEKNDHKFNFTLERGLCSLLFGDLDQCRSWLGIDDENSPYRDPSILEFVSAHSKDELADDNDLPGLCKLLEIWLLEVVFARFRDTQDVQFKLGDYYDDPNVLKYLERLEGGDGAHLLAALAIANIGTKVTVALDSIKSNAIHTLQKAFPFKSVSMMNVPSLQLQTKEFLAIPETINLSDVTDVAHIAGSSSSQFSTIEDVMTKNIRESTLKIFCGGIVVGLLTLLGLKYLPCRFGYSTPAITTNFTDIEKIPTMDAKFAESLIRKWHDIKSQALGPAHYLEEMPVVLDGQSLVVWTDKAREVAKKGWFWEYTLLNLDIDSVTLSFDGRRATVKVTLEEEAKLTDTLQLKHNDSHSTKYCTEFDMFYSKSGWKIIEDTVLQ